MKLRQLLLANIDRVVALGFVAVGAILLIVAWFGVSGKALAPEQIPYLVSGGLGGIFLGAIGCTVWLSADLQDDWRRLDSLEDKLSQLTRNEAAVAEVTELAKSNGRPRSARATTKVST